MNQSLLNLILIVIIALNLSGCSSQNVIPERNRSIASPPGNCNDLQDRLTSKTDDHVQLLDFNGSRFDPRGNNYSIALVDSINDYLFNDDLHRQWVGISNSLRVSPDKVMKILRSRPDYVATSEQLGFKLNELGKMEYPNFYELILNVNNLYNSRNIPLHERLYPSILLSRESAGEETEKMLFTPGVDRIPPESEGWKVDLTNPRLSADDFQKAINSGHFPVFFNGPHDIAHIISFINNREFLSLVRKMYRQKLVEPTGERGPGLARQVGLYRRALRNRAFVIEMLSLADPSKSDEIDRLLNIPLDNPRLKLSFFEDRALKMFKEDKANFLNDARRLVESFDSLMIHYNADLGDPHLYSYVVEQDGANVFGSFDDPIFHVANSEKNSLPRDLILSQAAAANSWYPHAFPILPKYLDVLISKELHQNNNDRWNELLDDALISIFSKIQYMLYRTSKDITVAQWFDDTVFNNESIEESITMLFLEELLGKQSGLYKILSHDKNY